MRKSYLTATLLLALAWPVSDHAQTSSDRVFTKNLINRPAEYVPGRVVVSFVESVSEGEAAEIALRAGASVRRKAFKKAFRVLSVPRGRVWQAINRLKRDPRVRYAHPDWLAYATQVKPNDFYYPYQWHFDNEEYGGIRLEDL